MKKLKKYLLKLAKFLGTWNELLTIPFGLVLFFMSPLFLRAFDPTAATIDAGVLQVIIFGLVKYSIASGFVWLVFKMQWPALYRRLDNLGVEQTDESKCKKEIFLKDFLPVFLYCFSLFVVIWCMGSL
ncbi:hypothetical protein V6R21_20100 [Limibacter armeniacum]|uniref:hypothetical protein n=1 Tax=Limibacter armeniacum TaxID=466084 RepID=UPI002FE5BBBA